jgi:hypothetical protein
MVERSQPRQGSKHPLKWRVASGERVFQQNRYQSSHPLLDGTTVSFRVPKATPPMSGMGREREFADADSGRSTGFRPEAAMAHPRERRQTALYRSDGTSECVSRRWLRPGWRRVVRRRGVASRGPLATGSSAAEAEVQGATADVRLRGGRGRTGLAPMWSAQSSGTIQAV